MNNIIFVPGEFLSTLSLRRATLHNNADCNYRSISIHALLAESDGVTVLGIQHRTGISIHALLAESDLASRLADMSAA